MATMIEALRTQTKAVERNNEKLDNMSNAVAKVREDIAVMKVRDEQFAALAAVTTDLAKRLDQVERRNSEQDGAFKFGVFIKEWLPWLFAGAAILWNMVKR